MLSGEFCASNRREAGEPEMDPEDLKAVLRTTGVDLWSLIETAISVAAAEHGRELKARRAGIVERLFTLSFVMVVARTATAKWRRRKQRGAAAPPGNARIHRRNGDEMKMTSTRMKTPRMRRKRDTTAPLMTSRARFSPSRISSMIQISLKILSSACSKISPTWISPSKLSRYQHHLLPNPRSPHLIPKLESGNRHREACEWPAETSFIRSEATREAARERMEIRPNQFQLRTTKMAIRWILEPDQRNGSDSVEPKARPAAAAAPRRETPPSKPPNSTPSSTATPKVKEKDSLLDPDRLASARKRLHETTRKLKMKAEDDSGDGHPRHPQTQEYLLRAEQRRVPDEALMSEDAAGIFSPSGPENLYGLGVNNLQLAASDFILIVFPLAQTQKVAVGTP
ncbi:hypothetical protein KSP40_PGU019719 [Platanthera guangdongensis]|uniref:Uncharacterized protein n=1 Tax=Platanthera guangdongensis TaxID=2320717 RepID=A0ABR2MSL5_9ASPA